MEFSLELVGGGKKKERPPTTDDLSHCTDETCSIGVEHEKANYGPVTAPA